MARRVVVEFVGKDTSAGSAALGVERKFDSLGSKLTKVGAVAGAAFAVAGAAAGKFAIDAVGAASDLNETLSKTATLFGKDQLGGMEKWAAGAAKAIGQSKQQALDAASTFAVFGKSAGLTGKDLTKFSTNFTGLASDLASFHNTSPEEAIEAIGAALRGEAEPMRRYGVLLDDASMRQEALRLGLVKTTKEALTPQQKVLAAQALIYKQTKDAQGDFAKTSDGLANQQRQLSAQFENVKVKLGEKLLPVALEVVSALNKDFIPAMQRAGQWAEDHLLPPLKEFGERVAPKVRDLMGKVKDAFSNAQPFFDLVGKIFTNVLAPAFTKAAEIYFPMLGRAIGLIGDALGVLGRAGIWLWNNAFAPTIRLLLNGFALMTEGWALVLRGLANVPGFGWARSAAQDMDTAAKKARDLARDIKEIPDQDVQVKVRYAVAGALPAAIPGGVGAAVAAAVAAANYKPKQKHARGTRGARRGVALVGEQGPELVQFGGGERVHTAQQTRGLLDGKGSGDRPIVVQLKVGARVLEQILIEHVRDTGRPLQVKTLGPS